MYKVRSYNLKVDKIEDGRVYCVIKKDLKDVLQVPLHRILGFRRHNELSSEADFSRLANISFFQRSDDHDYVHFDMDLDSFQQAVGQTGIGENDKFFWEAILDEKGVRRDYFTKDPRRVITSDEALEINLDVARSLGMEEEFAHQEVNMAIASATGLNYRIFSA